MSESLAGTLEASVLTLTLNRPEALNAFNVEMKDALLAALADAENNRAVRVLVITGAGRAFSAGQDLKERQDSHATDLGDELRARYNPLILAMRRLEKPIIGAINGIAAGAGLSLALACDIRIAADSASFIEVFGRVGLVPDSGSSWFLPRLIGPARAAEMVFTADQIDASTAERIGLVNKVVPDDQLLPEAYRSRAAPGEVCPACAGAGQASVEFGPRHESDRAARVRGGAPVDRRPFSRPW